MATCLWCISGQHARCIGQMGFECDCYRQSPQAHWDDDGSGEPDVRPEAEAADDAVRHLHAVNGDWTASAVAAVRKLAISKGRLTSADVWDQLERDGVPPPSDTRAMGAALRQASHAGLITLERANTRPKVWRSKTY